VMGAQWNYTYWNSNHAPSVAVITPMVLAQQIVQSTTAWVITDLRSYNRFLTT
jgi:hypothetical protein